MADPTAEQIIEHLGLQPHPEGGHFREVFRAKSADGTSRAPVTTIYFLLAAGEVSHWHRVDAVEIWNYHAGAPLALRIAQPNGTIDTVTLGTNLATGQSPQGIVPKDAWQSAQTLGDWTLVGCAVAPAFEFDGFELAPPGWSPEPTT